MGICYWDARALWEARLEGVSFKKTLTAGHLSLNLHPDEIDYFRREHRSRFNDQAPVLDQCEFYEFSDKFLRELLRAETISVMDYSDYEGADVIHDLNSPVPQALMGQYDAVIDGGTLEHVFNFPVAIANLMRMVKVDGWIFLALPANNLCGHGFYQFSPELMFRVFSKENGFDHVRVSFYEARYPSVELTPSRTLYDVSDPDKMFVRVGLISKGPVIMLVKAKKVQETIPFAKPPLQSDYVEHWKASAAATPVGRRKTSPIRGLAKKVFRRLPFWLQARLRGELQLREFSFSNRKFYKPRA